MWVFLTRSLSMVAFGDRKDFLQVLRMVHFRRKCTMRKTCKRDTGRGKASACTGLLPFSRVGFFMSTLPKVAHELSCNEFPCAWACGGGLETPSGEPKERPASKRHVAHGSTGRSPSAGFGLASFLLMVARRQAAMRDLQNVAAQVDVPARSFWPLGNAGDGCLMGRCFGWSIGQQSGVFGLSTRLLLLLACQRCGVFGLSARLLLGLVRCSRLDALCSLELPVGTLSLALLLGTTLFLELVASGHTAHPIQAPGQRLGPHPSWRQALLATRLSRPHRHHPSHDHTLFSPPWTLLGQGGPPTTPLLAPGAPRLFPLCFLLLGLQLPSQQ